MKRISELVGFFAAIFLAAGVANAGKYEDTIALFRKEIASGQDPDAKAFAKETLPTIRSHLNAINTIASAAGVSK